MAESKINTPYFKVDNESTILPSISPNGTIEITITGSKTGYTLIGNVGSAVFGTDTFVMIGRVYSSSPNVYNVTLINTGNAGSGINGSFLFAGLYIKN